MILNIEPKSVLKKLIGIISILLLANIISIIHQFNYPSNDQVGFTVKTLRELFDFNLEANIPTFFSSILLFLCSLLLLIMGQNEKMENKKYTRWYILSLIFSFLAIDEFVQLHEALMYIIRYVINPGGLFYYGWVIAYGIILILLIPFFFRFLMGIPFITRRLMFIAGSIYIFGALILVLPEGLVSEKYGFNDGPFFYFLYTCQELFEMLGLCLFIYSLLSYKNLKIKFK